VTHYIQQQCSGWTITENTGSEQAVISPLCYWAGILGRPNSSTGTPSYRTEHTSVTQWENQTSLIKTTIITIIRHCSLLELTYLTVYSLNAKLNFKTIIEQSHHSNSSKIQVWEVAVYSVASENDMPW